MTHPTRRRVLSIAAAASLAPLAAGAGAVSKADRVETRRWRGLALGATAEITLIGPADKADRALAGARLTIRMAERLFSLYDPESMLSRLNRDGALTGPAPFHALLDLADRLHQITGGRFDPSVQPLWRALAKGADAAAARRLVGWDRVGLGPRITLAPGQALTLNGVAQGFATDMTAEALASAGFDRALVNIGEFRAGDGDWRIGVDDPTAGPVGALTLSRGAVATSSPGATVIGGAPHILDPDGAGAARWSTVSVEASTAALADGLSTAFCLMSRREIAAALAAAQGATRARLVNHAGDVETIRA